MARNSHKTSRSELLRQISTGLRTAAVRPNVHGYRPHIKQQTFHKSTAKGRLFLGGNRSGKTVAGAVECVWWLTGTHPFLKTPPPPVRGRVVSVDFLNGVEKITRPEVARWLPQSALRGGSWSNAYNKELRTLTLDNGSFLEFMSYDQDLDKFAGTSRHFTWFDEEPPQDVYIECRMRLLDTGGSYWITMTPVEGMTWVYDDIYLASRSDPNLLTVEVDMGENPYLNHEEIDAFLAGLTDDERKARVKGQFVRVGGLIYKHFSDKHIIDPFSPPTEWLQVAAMDHGIRNPTAWLWAAIDREGRIFVFDEHYESDKVVAYHAQRVHEINSQHGRAPDYYVGDPSIRNTDPITGTSILLEYMEFGVPIILGNNDVSAGINRVTRYFGDDTTPPRLFVTRNCVNLIYELQRLRWKTWQTKKLQRERDPQELQHKKDDHAADALRYLVASRPEWDDGKDIPEKLGPMGASVAIGDSLVDDAVLQPKTVWVEENMGSEW